MCRTTLPDHARIDLHAKHAGQSSYPWQPGQLHFQLRPECPSGNVAVDPTCGTSVFDVYSVNQNFHTAYFFNYNLNVQKSLGNGAAVWQVGYVGSEGRRLSVLLNINQPIDASWYAAVLCCQYPNFGAINQLNSIGTSNYNALQTTLRLRGWHGLSSQFGYTWAHNLDEISAYRGVIPFDSYNLKADYGNSDFDTRHTFTGTLSWDLPGSCPRTEGTDPWVERQQFLELPRRATATTRFAKVWISLAIRLVGVSHSFVQDVAAFHWRSMGQPEPPFAKPPS